MNNFKKTLQILNIGSKKDKIKVLGLLSQSTNPEIIKKIISNLDDQEIQVRGEAFSSLFLNENDISEFLIDGLRSESKYIKGFSALILANRGDSNAIPNLELLTRDPSGMVRSCALGALGYLHSNQSSTIIRNCFSDEVVEVKKSALEAFFKIGGKIFSNEIEKLSRNADTELKFLIKKYQKICNGPGGI